MRLFVSCILCIIVLLTNRWLTFEEGMSILVADDTKSYMIMAQAAPGLPNNGIMLASNHTKRIVPSWIAGCLRYLLPMSDFQAFLFLTIVTCALIVFVVHTLLSDLQLSDAQYSLCMAMFILNPYTFRYYLAVPAMVSDLVFVLGLSLIVLFIFRQKTWILVIGCIIAVCGRQNALIIVPALVIWFIFSSKWHHRAKLHFVQQGGLVVVSIFVPYLLLYFLTNPFSERGLENESLTGLWNWIISSSPRKIMVFAEFIFRALIAIIFIVFLLLGATLAKKTRLRIIRQLPREFLLMGAMFFSLFGFALLGGPELFMTGITRYVSHTIILIIVCSALLFRELNIVENLTERNALLYFILGLLLSISSFHHLTSFAGGNSSKNAAYFSVIVVLSAILSAITMYLLTKKEIGDKHH